MPLDELSKAIIAEVDKVMGRLGSEITDASAARASLSPPEGVFTRPDPTDTESHAAMAPDGHQVPVRVYRPTRAAAGTLPAVVYCHGGGWVFGDLDSEDNICRAITDGADVVVVSVDYRLAPEHPFPTPLEDVYTALTWTYDNAEDLGIDRGLLAVAGSSAGGNLAASCALVARDRGGPALALQLLFYPVLDANFSRSSYRRNGSGFLLTTTHMRWFWDQYAGSQVRTDPYLAPCQAVDLAGLPPAYLAVAGYDVLLDEGEHYARRLAAAGVPTTVRRYEEAFHGFLAFTDVLPIARQALNDGIECLAEALGRA